MTSCVLFRGERLLAVSGAVGPVLGIDTATPKASLAVIAHGRVLAEAERDVKSHGASLPAEASEIVRAANLSFDDLSGIAVAIGPGSFTGLRVGLSYTKGLAMALRRRVVGVPTLDALALSAVQTAKTRENAMICAVLDARKGEVYAALYRVMSDRLEKVSDDLVVTLEWLIPRVSGEVVFAGDRNAADAQSLISARGGRATYVTESTLPARARFVAEVGASRLASGESDDIAGLEPLYVRPPEATLKVAGGSATIAEGLWSRGKSNSLSSTQTTTRN
jgi:tRNA threonylcarbamoyladenosine biosynthesis protein TsaB